MMFYNKQYDHNANIISLGRLGTSIFCAIVQLAMRSSLYQNKCIKCCTLLTTLHLFKWFRQSSITDVYAYKLLQ